MPDPNAQSSVRRKRKHRVEPTGDSPTVQASPRISAVASTAVWEPENDGVRELRPDDTVRVMSAEELKSERHWGWIAGAAGIGTAVLTVAAVPVAASGPRINAPSGSDKALLLGASLAGQAQVISMWMRVASVLLVIPFAWFMFRAVRARNPGHSRYIPIVGFVAFAIVAVSTAVGFFEVRDAAHIYVHSGPRTVARANHVLTLQRDKGPLRIADIAQFVGGFLFGIWISLVSFEAMRVGLLTRFLGIFGVGAGVTTVIGLPIGPAIFIGWLASLCCLAVGYWPGGMPPAWTAGRAVSPDETSLLMNTPRRSARQR